jgi:phosphatidylinositol kinase/protein kinase (PI-3  family)
MLDTVDRKLLGNIHNGAALTIEEQVEQVIMNAVNDESLSKMYVGWMPWL